MIVSLGYIKGSLQRLPRSACTLGNSSLESCTLHPHSSLTSKMSGSRIAQPRPSRLGTGRMSPDLRADQGGFSNSFQQSNQRRENAYYSATSQLREESAAQSSEESAARSREEATERIETRDREFLTRRRKFTLSNCRLELEQSTLTISPASSEDDFDSNTVNLDDFVGNISGELVWGAGEVNFSESSTSIRLQKTLLLAACSRGNEVPITPDPEFAELMSSADWMNFTVITQPDMRGFFKSPAFQRSVTSVARSAVEEVMKQMRTKMMEAVETAIKRVSDESEEFILTEMDALVKKATRTAAYAGLGRLKIMQLEQRRAFNLFAPHIAAPIVDEVEPDESD
ncbi:hypothetical protein B0H12DRAFT_1102160 [Mycena haematopus]|nr:hypothetical protein B0H12DRAFT_1102160 [Mycena haematopus]